MSAGAFAVTRALQHGHAARNRLIRVVIGLIGGRSTWSQTLEFLACLFERGAARASFGVDVACRVRVLYERSRRARTTLAGFLHPRRLRDVPLLTARRRQRRVVRRLRRLIVLGLKLGDADQQCFVLRHQLIDARREPADLPQQLQHQRLHVISERINLFRRHASLKQPA
jgi:hypothetical protein